MRRWCACAVLGGVLLAAAWLTGCGTRTDLLLDESGSTQNPSTPEQPEGGSGGRAPPAADPSAPPEGAPDRPVPPGCTVGEYEIYLLSDSDELFTFDPLTLATTRIGPLNCGEGLNTMSIARSGEAYVASYDGQLYRVDTATARCTPTPFDRDQLWGSKYGMGFVADDVPGGESLYITEEQGFTTVERLSIIDLSTYELQLVAFFDPPLPPTEITGTGDGRMYGFAIPSGSRAARLVEIDPQTARVTDIVELPFVDSVRAFDFAFWGGDFYLFLTPWEEADASVVRYRPSDRSVAMLGSIDPIVIGAGVSTCAPL